MFRGQVDWERNQQLLPFPFKFVSAPAQPAVPMRGCPPGLFLGQGSGVVPQTGFDVRIRLQPHLHQAANVLLGDRALD